MKLVTPEHTIEVVTEAFILDVTPPGSEYKECKALPGWCRLTIKVDGAVVGVMLAAPWNSSQAKDIRDQLRMLGPVEIGGETP